MWLGSCSKKSKLSVELGSMYIVSDKTLKLCFTSPKKTIVSTWNSKNIKPKNDSWYDKISMNDMNEYEYNFDNFQNMAFRLKISFEAKTKSNMTVRVYADFIHLGMCVSFLYFSMCLLSEFCRNSNRRQRRRSTYGLRQWFQSFYCLEMSSCNRKC